LFCKCFFKPSSYIQKMKLNIDLFETLIILFTFYNSRTTWMKKHGNVHIRKKPSGILIKLIESERSTYNISNSLCTPSLSVEFYSWFIDVDIHTHWTCFIDALHGLICPSKKWFIFLVDYHIYDVVNGVALSNFSMISTFWRVTGVDKQ